MTDGKCDNKDQEIDKGNEEPSNLKRTHNHSRKAALSINKQRGRNNVEDINKDGHESSQHHPKTRTLHQPSQQNPDPYTAHGLYPVDFVTKKKMHSSTTGRALM
jgi:hypothetical protein